MPEITPPPPAPVTRALLRLLAAALVVLASLFVVLSVAYFRLDSRATKQADQLSGFRRLAAAIATLSDPEASDAERDAARAEAQRVVVNTQQGERGAAGPVGPPGPAATSPGSPAPAATTPPRGAATTTTTTTRACTLRLPLVEVCQR